MPKLQPQTHKLAMYLSQSKSECCCGIDWGTCHLPPQQATTTCTLYEAALIELFKIRHLSSAPLRFAYVGARPGPGKCSLAPYRTRVCAWWENRILEAPFLPHFWARSLFYRPVQKHFQVNTKRYVLGIFEGNATLKSNIFLNLVEHTTQCCWH